MQEMSEEAGRIKITVEAYGEKYTLEFSDETDIAGIQNGAIKWRTLNVAKPLL